MRYPTRTRCAALVLFLGLAGCGGVSDEDPPPRLDGHVPGADGGDLPRRDGATPEADGGARDAGVLPPGSPAATESTTTIEHDGVTIELAEAALVGHFIDGTPFVVGEVTVTGYTPAPTTGSRAMNGCMINPAIGDHVGFDSLGGDSYDPDLNCATDLPVTLAPGDSMLIAVSIASATERKGHLDHVIVLTVVAEVPPEDAFRPAYAGSSFQTIYRYAQVDTSRLARLTSVGSAPSVDSIASRYARITIDLVPNWNRDHLVTEGNGPLYGRDLCGSEGTGYLLANTDLSDEEKRPLLIGLVQRGIDRYGLLLSSVEHGGWPWAADGGHNSGRKFSIMFAGALLGVPEMRDVVQRSDTPTNPNTTRQFHEDAMTFHVTEAHVAATNSSRWNPPYRDTRPLHQPYSSSMIDMPDWRGKGNTPPEQTDASWTGHAYRLSQNAGSQHGQALAALVMGLDEAWGHPAYFDYHTRFLAIMNSQPDPWGTMRGASHAYDPVLGSIEAEGFEGWQMYWRDEWAWDMAQTYWHDHYDYPWE